MDEVIPELTTTDSTVYRSVHISNVTPSYITITHDGGVAKIPMEQLPEDMRSRLGYDPEAAKRHADSLAAQNQALATKTAKEAANRKILENAFSEIRGTIASFEEDGLIVDVDYSWDGKSYYIEPEFLRSGTGGSHGQGGWHTYKNEKWGQKSKVLKTHPRETLVFIRCDVSDFVGKTDFVGNTWRNGTRSYANLIVPAYTTNSSDLLKK